MNLFPGDECYDTDYVYPDYADFDAYCIANASHILRRPVTWVSTKWSGGGELGLKVGDDSGILGWISVADPDDMPMFGLPDMKAFREAGVGYLIDGVGAQPGECPMCRRLPRRPLGHSGPHLQSKG